MNIKEAGETRRVMRPLPALSLIASLCLAALAAPAQADSAADFYKGKTVSLIAGFPPAAATTPMCVCSLATMAVSSPVNRQWSRRICRAPVR